MTPDVVARTVVAEEMGAATAWAERHAWSVMFDEAALAVTGSTLHPVDGRPVVLVGDFHGYRARPPAWRFVDPSTRQPAPSAFPLGGPVDIGGGTKPSIFISHSTGPVICAPFNSLAYAEARGPHGDWGEAPNWLNYLANTTADVVKAATIADMLATVALHLRFSPGRFS